MTTSKCHRQRPPSLHKAEVEFENLVVTVHLFNNTGFVVVVNKVKIMNFVGVVVKVIKRRVWWVWSIR